jgi:hypothetical protein
MCGDTIGKSGKRMSFWSRDLFVLYGSSLSIVIIEKKILSGKVKLKTAFLDSISKRGFSGYYLRKVKRKGLFRDSISNLINLII